MKKISLPILLLLCLNVLQAQQLEGTESLRMAPRANVITYDAEKSIEHLMYDNSSYIYPLDDDWQMGSYDGRVSLSQSYLFPKDWKGFRIFFRMVSPAGYGLYINNKLIGVSHDCASITEFDITELLRWGKVHTLEMRYAGKDDGEDLEDFPLVNDKVESIFQASLLLKPELNIQDYLIETEYDAVSKQGSYRLEADLFNQKRKGKSYIELEIWDAKGHQVDKLGKWCFFDKRSESSQVIKSEIPNVQPWNAESPRLYTAVIRLYDENMNLQDLVGTKFGFRSLGEKNSITVNGRKITFKGVVINTPIIKSEADVKRLRSELVQMKCNNINALYVTGSNPYCEKLFELCDELGFYVVSDVVMSPASNRGNAVAADPNYSELFSDRVRSMYGQLKNHPSIVAWSIGNSLDNGVCMQGIYRTLHQLDAKRPVIYPGAQYAENTDLIALPHSTPTMLGQYISKGQSRSFIMSSYGSAEGNNFGGIVPLWQKVIDHQSIQGGFFEIFEWSELANKPYLGELKQLYRPIDVRLTATSVDAAEFLITNLSDFRSMADFHLDYVICSNLKPNIVSGDVAMALKPGESKDFKLKVPKLLLYAGEQLYIKFTLRQRGNSSAVPKNWVLYTEQIPLPSDNMPLQPYVCHEGTALQIAKDSARQTVISNNVVSLTFNDSLGAVTQLSFQGHQLLTRPIQLSFMRNPSPNDMRDPNGLKHWNRFLMGNVQTEVVASTCRQLDDGNVGIDVMTRYSSDRGDVLFDIRQAYLILRSGDVLISNDIIVSDQIQSLARVGMTMGLSKQLDTAQWLGRNVESYSDRNASGLIAQQQAPISSLHQRYDFTGQHQGNHAQTSWVSFFNSSYGLYADIIDALCNYSIYPFADEDLAISQDDSQLPDPSDWTFHLDYRMAGVGSSVAGIPIAPTDLVKDHKYLFTIHLRPYDCMEYAPQDFRRIVYPKVVSNIVEMPVISKNRDRFDGPMQIQIACPTKGAEIRYTLDGTVPTEKSALYTKPFTIQSSLVVKARAFKKNEAPSFVASEQFSFDYIVSCHFANKPNTPYNKNAAKALFDGEMGDINDLSHGWLGFSGRDVQVDLELGKPISIQQVKLRFAHVPEAWVFAPQRVEVAVSADGKSFTPFVEGEISYDPNAESMNSMQLQMLNIPIKEDQVRYVRIVAHPIARIPQWHRAKGLKPWIMMDEIEVVDDLSNTSQSPADSNNSK